MYLKMVPYSGTRTITLIVALATLASNVLSALFFYQLPDDPYHLANNFGWYLHFANLLSVFGFIGALRQHAPSVAIFANYLILDTLLSTIPRFLLLLTITSFSSSICSPTNTLNPSTAFSSSSSSSDQQLPSLTNPASSFNHPSPNSDDMSLLYALAPMRSPHSEYLSQSDFTPESCMRTVYLGQLMLGAGVVVATVLQLVGAMCVRGYARVLWVREMREEEMAAAAQMARLVVLEREGGDGGERYFDDERRMGTGKV
ncbi:hypothetical protein ONS95_004361 [Cadophora gregata]|uniref:uncharacterized protein n=1 Tax=Cadophora gregata TaxID=51156 RepID=UPI0026DCA1A2|nr:uncharacterized protein ONS95_004361 [Cadophora gregata]KAK0105250.1 hypothetical protein ONS96_004647 [Cadophora gregata f. sp. sojae]KAK0105846.1 hypothetical protein ONS95_004361 [Cadophora gregata]